MGVMYLAVKERHGYSVWITEIPLVYHIELRHGKCDKKYRYTAGGAEGMVRLFSRGLLLSDCSMDLPHQAIKEILGTPELL